MSTPTHDPVAHISRVDISGPWFSFVGWSMYDGSLCVHELGRDKNAKDGININVPNLEHTPDRASKQLAIVRFLYDKKIGQLGCVWLKEGIPIEFKYANVKFGDLFDFYTTANGVLVWPEWSSLRLVVGEFLEHQDARVKFHPARVEQCIAEHGVDNVEHMA